MVPRTLRRPLFLGPHPRRRRAAPAAALMALVLGAPSPLLAQAGSGAVAFEQLEALLPTPNVYRTATGEPGPQYWQQQVDYVIEVSLDEAAKRIQGSERITYRSHAPSPLRYLWVQLDQNRFRADSLARRSETTERRRDPRRDDEQERDNLSFRTLRRAQAFKDSEHGYEITRVADAKGRPLAHTIVDTMMRIDLPRPLRGGESFVFEIDWAHNIIDQAAIGGRGGYERFDAAEKETFIYFLAQWFPRLAAFTDYTGWQHKAFLGAGEFTLEFGDYDVSITVPSDHVVSATGELENPSAVLSATQRQRLAAAREAKAPVFIVTPEEAAENEKEGTDETRTWRFQAKGVRDFAWASSRKFIWDAMAHHQDDAANPTVMAMSFYPGEAEPIWSKYSTHAVAHTMEVYSRFSFPYPYPTSQSVNTWKRGGMEYPMMTFNGYRPQVKEETGRTYSRRVKYGLIGVIIHEVGHNYFPMTVNSDERRWTWMDEGLNTFLQTLAQFEWEEDYPRFAGRPYSLDAITEYMKSENQVPIMTHSDSLLQFGNNAYAKPTAAFIVLRETVMGRELFDFAFKEYARRWRFKRPTPADFFRTMEDASGVDLDWFWRGWFYTTDHVDVAIADVREYKVSSKDPEVEHPLGRERSRRDHPEPLTQSRNREEGRATRVERHPELEDFYNENDRFTVSNQDRNEQTRFLKKLEDWERDVLERAIEEDDVYFVEFVNEGGLVTPIPLTITYEDASVEELMIPAEIWRRDAREVMKLLIRPKRISSISLDERRQIADVDRSDNHFPRRMIPSRLELYKRKSEDRNLMAGMLVELRGKDELTDDDSSEVPLKPVERE